MTKTRVRYKVAKHLASYIVYAAEAEIITPNNTDNKTYILKIYITYIDIGYIVIGSSKGVK